MEPSDLIIRFRQLVPFKQAVIVGLLFLLIYGIYGYFIAGLEFMNAMESALYSAILFMCVYYFTTVILVRKTAVDAARSKAKGPKGRRKF